MEWKQTVCWNPLIVPGIYCLGTVQMFGTFRTSLSNKMLMQDEHFFLIQLGQDMADNTGRRQRAKDAKQRVKLVVEAFATMPKTDYIKMLAHNLQRASAL